MSNLLHQSQPPHPNKLQPKNKVSQQKNRKARHVTHRWLSRQRNFLWLDVPKSCEFFVANLQQIDEIHSISKATFGDTALKKKVLRRYMTKAHAIIFGLSIEQQIAAYCVAEFHRGHRKVYVVETCVKPEHQGKGLAKWLRTQLDKLSISRGYWTIASNVRVTNQPAIQLNLSCGMTISKRIKEYYEDYTDGFYLTKELRRKIPE